LVDLRAHNDMIPRRIASVRSLRYPVDLKDLPVKSDMAREKKRRSCGHVITTAFERPPSDGLHQVGGPRTMTSRGGRRLGYATA
jgi:hypothetical protein